MIQISTDPEPRRSSLGPPAPPEPQSGGPVPAEPAPAPLGTPSPARTARGEATRQRLLDAAERVFGQKRYYGTAVTDITREAGMALGTFYVYFPSKQAIFRELVLHLGKSLRRTIREATGGLTDRLDVERAGFRSFLRFVQRHKNLYRIVREAEYVDEEIFRWYYTTLGEAYSRGLAEAAKAGQITTPDPAAAAWALMAVADYLGMRWVLWENREPPDEVFEATMHFIRHGLAPGGPGRG